MSRNPNGDRPGQGEQSYGVLAVHSVEFTEKRIECISECPGRLPHLSEYRAGDVNPNR